MSNDDELRRLAQERHMTHKHHASSRPLSPDYELVGLQGERTIEHLTGIPMDRLKRPGGDGGVDFVLPMRFDVPVDIKTARKPSNLIVEVGKVGVKTAYILARYAPDQEFAEILGWEWGSVVAKAPTKDFGYGIVNHYIAAADLRPIAELLSRVVREKGQ